MPSEFGGTFSLTNDTVSYAGRFAAERAYITASKTFGTTHANMPKTLNQHNLTGFGAGNRARKVGTALKTTIVEITSDSATKTVSSNRITGAITEIGYAASGNFSNLALYLGDRKYQATSVGGSLGRIADSTPYGGGSDNPTWLAIYNENTHYGFKLDYMSLVYWEVKRGTYYTRGFGMAGFETDGNAIPTADSFIFTGKGHGVYTVAGSAYNAIAFDLTADVDFSTRIVDLASTKTCRTIHALCKVSDALQTDFDFTGKLRYDADTNVISGAIETKGDAVKNIAELYGTADARFYGPAVEELGGTFSLKNDTVSYVGRFGAERSDVASDTTGETIYVATLPEINQHNITAFNDGNRKGKKGNALTTSLVEITSDNATKTVSSNGIKDAIAEIDYATNGNFADLTLHLGDKKYQTSYGVSSLGGITDSTPYTDSSDAPVWLAIYNENTQFGFKLDYMALLYWELKTDSNHTRGYGMTGFETDGNAIPTADSFIFTGVGHGDYAVTDSVYHSIAFDITADVDFSERTVVLESTKTCRTTSSLCQEISPLQADLNFKGTLNYIADTNVISGVIETKGDAVNNIAKLTGTADARFYGNGADVPSEFGGTFSLTNNTVSYVGRFGAERDYITASKTVVTSHTDTPKTLNTNNLTAFNDGNRYGEKNNALATSLVEITSDNATKTVSSNGIKDAIAEIDYATNGNFADLTLYLGDRKYQTSYGVSSLGGITDSTPYTDSADAPILLAIYNENTQFGFTLDYMSMVYWEVKRDTYHTKGFGMTGFETDGNAIPTADSYIFTGKGQGVYAVADSVYHDVAFDITADVDFSTRTVDLESTKTCRTTSSLCQEISPLQADLNFKGTLIYTAGENVINGNIETKGDADNVKLTGTADARFYGNDADVPSEFGGTFGLTNNTISYVGRFGAERDYITASKTVGTSHTDTPKTLNANNLTAFNDGNRYGEKNNALATSLVEITSNSATKMVSSNGIKDAIAEIDYATNGNFADLALYLGDKKYQTSYGVSSLGGITDNTPYTDSSDAPVLLAIYNEKSQFGFNSNYMALLYWELKTDTSHTRGYGMTGFETDGNAIPIAGSVKFTGAGQGVYAVADSVYHDVAFDITADVDFSKRTVDLESTKTCRTTSSLCQEVSPLQADLNFKGTLVYIAGENVITGNIVTKGDADNVALTGTADARFYGPSAEELGGTFSMTSDKAGFVGRFGAKK